MLERNAQIVLLVRAFEEVDREGRVLTHVRLATATHRARMVTVMEDAASRFARPGEETLVRRARHVFRGLRKTVPRVYQVMELARLRSLLAPSLVAGALLLGVALAGLGTRPGVDMASLPLLFLVAWNVAVYITLAVVRIVRPMLRRLKPVGDMVRRHPLAAGLAEWVVRGALWRSRVGWSRQARASGGSRAITARAFVRFCALWHRTARPLLVMRIRAALHVASIALIAGTLFGMWLRVVPLGHEAYLSGAPLGPGTVEPLLRIVLGPAAVSTGTDVGRLLETGSTLSLAARELWLRLWGLTSLLFVALPRSGLAIYTVWRASRMATFIPIDLEEPYYRRVLS